MKTFKHLAEKFHGTLPTVCVLCQTRCLDTLDICPDCIAHLPHIKHACHRCALPIEAKNTHNICGSCISKKPEYDNIFSPFLYQQAMTKLIAQMKFYHSLTHANVLGHLLAISMREHYDDLTPNIIIPVPLHSSRLRHRGYNQVIELAKPCAKALHIPISRRDCRRTVATATQSTLPANKRRQNVRNAFHTQQDWTDKHVVLLDDVITTGATVSALSHTLRQHGARQIDVWGCARAAHPP